MRPSRLTDSYEIVIKTKTIVNTRVSFSDKRSTTEKFIQIPSPFLWGPHGYTYL